MEWICNNKEWLFSGIGVAVIGLGIKFFFRKKSERIVNMKGDKSVYVEKNEGKIDIS